MYNIKFVYKYINTYILHTIYIYILSYICNLHLHLLQGKHCSHSQFNHAAPRPVGLQSRCFEDSKQLNSHRKGRSAASLAIAKSVKIENCDHMPPYAII